MRFHPALNLYPAVVFRAGNPKYFSNYGREVGGKEPDLRLNSKLAKGGLRYFPESSKAPLGFSYRFPFFFFLPICYSVYLSLFRFLDFRFNFAPIFLSLHWKSRSMKIPFHYAERGKKATTKKKRHNLVFNFSRNERTITWNHANIQNSLPAGFSLHVDSNKQGMESFPQPHRK